MIEQIMSAYLGAFSTQISDPKLAADVEKFKKDLENLANTSKDVTDFMTRMDTEGIMQRQAELLNRLHAPKPETSAAKPTGSVPSTTTKLPSVKEFIEQFRPAAEAAKAHGYQPRAVKAYEELLRLGDATDDLLELQLLLIESNLLFLPVSMAFYDINKLGFDSQNPNNEATRRQFAALMELAEKSSSSEELDYLNDLAITSSQQFSYRFYWQRQVYPSTLANYLLDYLYDKHIIWSKSVSLDTKLIQAENFVYLRAGLKKFLNAATQLTGFSFDDLAEHPYSRLFLLAAKPIDALALAYCGFDDEVLALYKEIIAEVVSDKTNEEILSTVPQNPMRWGLDDQIPEQKLVLDKIAEAAEAELSKRYYYNYFMKGVAPPTQPVSAQGA